jgi:hypothetical protein
MIYLIFIATAFSAGSLGFLLGAMMATAKRSDNQDEILYRQVVNEDIAEFERRYQAAQ